MRDTIDLLATLANDPSPPRDLAKLLDVFRRQRSNNDGD